MSGLEFQMAYERIPGERARGGLTKYVESFYCRMTVASAEREQSEVGYRGIQIWGRSSVHSHRHDVYHISTKILFPSYHHQENMRLYYVCYFYQAQRIGTLEKRKKLYLNKMKLIIPCADCHIFQTILLA